MRAPALVQIVLLGLFTAVGLMGAVAVAIDWVQGLDTWFWEESTCTIESSEAVERPDYGDSEFQVSYRYFHRGEQQLGDGYRHGYAGSELASEAEILVSRYAVGSRSQCWVDPDEPGESYLRRADLWQGFWILVPLAFVAVGGGALWLLHGPRTRSDVEEEPGDRGPVRERAVSGVKIAALIFLPGVFFLFGAGVLIPFFVRPALQVVEARFWTEVPCEILSSEVRSHPGDDGATYSIDALFRYELGGREYRANRYQFIGGSSGAYDGKARIVEALPAGATTVCYVNPEDPFDAVIERGFTGDYLFGLVPLLFALIGMGGLAFGIKVLRGARQDAAIASWPDLAVSGEAAAGGAYGGFGWASGGSAIETPAGSIVLEPSIGPMGRLGCATVGALFWNGFISIFVWQVVKSWRAGNPEWFVIIILAPFVLIGLLLLVSVPYSILALVNPRPRVQLSPGALKAGESAQIEWAFRGFGGRIRHLRIWLEATETTTRETGSSLSIESRALDTPTIPVLDRGPDQPLADGAASFEVPADTPLSSDGDVAIRWKLMLHGEIAFWPDVNETFEVRVIG